MNASGVGGAPEPDHKLPSFGALEAGDTQGEGADISGLLHAKVGNLDELKAVLIKYLGEKDGMKFYNQFITTFEMTMLNQIQQSAKAAQQASKQMRSDNQT